jgi:hypothetical protein
MILHIFRKDWLLNWKPVIAVAGIQMAFTAIQIRQTLDGHNSVLQQLSQVLLVLWLMASCILVIHLVHQDALAGTKQDWLTRPIARKHVLIEKVLFTVLCVQGASILGDLLQGLICGFPLGQTIGATVARAIAFFIIVMLPVLALGAVTQSVTEAVILAVVAAFGVFAVIMVSIGMAGGYDHPFDPTKFTGEEWLTDGLRFVMFFIGITAVLIWQYRTRRTIVARALMATVLAITLGSQFIPWTPVFAVQEKLSPEPGAGAKLSVAWRPEGHLSGDSSTNISPGTTGSATGSGRYMLPILVRGMPANAVLKADRSEFTISDQAGKRIFTGVGGNVEVRNEDTLGNQAFYDQVVQIPPHVLQGNKSQLVRANVVYSFTLFKLGAAYSLSAVADNQRLPGWGLCKSSINSDETSLEITCTQIGKGPTCATVFLEHTPSGRRNPVSTACFPNYAPYLDRPVPDAMFHFRFILPFRDPSGLTKYPVDSTQLADSKIVIRMYVPQDHFTREVASPILSIHDFTNE